MSEFPTRVTVTGHRPKYYKTPMRSWGKVTDAMYEVALEYVKYHREERRLYNIGMAVGWDLAMAQACANCGVPFVAYVPCADQERLWPDHTQAQYRKLMGKADDIVWCSHEPYRAQLMRDRNLRMVYDCERVVALFNPEEEHSGTKHLIVHALNAGRPIDNLHNKLLAYFEAHPHG